MSSEYIKHNGQRKKKREVISRGKRYKYNRTGKIVEIGGVDPDTGATVVQGADDFVIGGTKSSLRRIADLESNVAILYTKLTTSDGDAASASESSDDVTIGKSGQVSRFKGECRFEKDVRFDDEIDASSSATCTATFAAKVAAAGGLATDSEVATAKSQAISTAASDATSKANSAENSANSYTDTAISNLVNGASASFNTLKEIQDAMATDAELSAAIAGLTIGNATITISAGNGLGGGAAFTTNQTSNETVTLSVNTGNGLTISSDQVQMSGSYTGTFTATGDICAYSDASLKTNVQTINGAMGKVDAIRGVTFERLEDGSTSTGVIAQELEAVLPEAVQTDEHGVKMVAYGNVTGLLIEALKELKAEVESLKK